MKSHNSQEACLDKFKSRYRKLSALMFIDNNNDTHNIDGDETPFTMQRKMLRRRHVRKQQKEKARQQKETEQRKRRRSDEASKQSIGLCAPSSPSMITTNVAPETWVSPPCRCSDERAERTSSPLCGDSIGFSSAARAPPQTVVSPAPPVPLLAPSEETLIPPFSPLRSRKRRRNLF